MLKVVIVDDERLVREGIKIILREEKLSVEITGEARNGLEAFELICRNMPDIVITDIRMPAMDGISLIEKVKSVSQTVKFIIISGFAEFQYAKSAIEMGVNDYVLKPIRNEELSTAVKKASLEIEEMKYAQQEVKKIQLMEKENLHMIMEKSFNILLFSKEQTDDICNSIYRSIPQLKDVYVLLGIFHINHPSTYESCFQNDDYELARFSIQNILEEVCTHSALTWSNFNDRTELFVLFYDKDKKQIIYEGSKFISEVFTKILNIIPNSVMVGVSESHKDISSLSQCYEEAKSALSRRFSSDMGNFFKYGDMENIFKRKFHFPEHKLHTLRIALERGNLENGLDEVEKIIGDIFSFTNQGDIEFIHLKMLFIETVRIVTIYCGRMKLNISDFISERAASGEILADFSNLNDIKKYTVSLIRRINKSGDPVSKDTKLLIPIIEEYLKNNFHKDICLEDMAQKHNISVKYLSRTFKNVTGRNFSDYLFEIRINKAKQLLEDTKFTVHEIAISVGYGDPQYFHRIFKKHYGVTPNEYRAMK
jgi:two-component system, response regulator YesN